MYLKEAQELSRKPGQSLPAWLFSRRPVEERRSVEASKFLNCHNQDDLLEINTGVLLRVFHTY